MTTTGPVVPDDERTRVPKYYRVKQRLRELIDGAEPGTSLPTERALSETFDTSRVTVRQALQELAAEGRVNRVQGRGTFVLPPKVTVPLQLTSHTESMRERHLVATSRVLEVVQVDASNEVVRALELTPGTRVERISRVRLADGEPMAIENVHLVAAAVPGIGEHIDDRASLYAVLREQYGIEPARATQTLESAVASPAEASLLDVDTGSPLLLLTRTSHGAAGRPVEYTTSVYRGDRYRFVTSLHPRER